MLLTDEQLQLEISLARITFLNFNQKKKLRENIDSPYNLSLLSIEDIRKITGKDISAKAVWNGPENFRMAQVALFYCKKMNIRILLHYEQEYPELLRQISDPPYLLYCRGNVSILTEGKSVSVVGTRKITQSGREAAKNFSYDACMNSCNVVSGLASGVDGNAHQGAVTACYDALEKGLDMNAIGKTIAVLPSSIDEVVPYSNRKLAEQILKTGGLLISEYEPGMGMANWHFVGRNRIIAGLSPATVVIEAPAGSGALITADFALEYNRDVMFHQTAFGKMAKLVADNVQNELEKNYAAGTVSKYKLENSPQKFIEAGAPVIKDYGDYCKCLLESPGNRCMEPVQGLLF